MTTEPTTTIPEDFDLLDYISSGTIARREVTLYADDDAGRDLLAALDELRDLGWSEDQSEDDRERARQERSLAESGESDAIREAKARAEAAQERLEASKTVWTVQALPADVSQEIVDSIPLPEQPTPPKEGMQASEQARARFQKRWVAYQKAAEEAQDAQRAAILARAVVEVSHPASGRVTEGASVEAIAAMRDRRAGGRVWFDKLWKALEDAQSSDPDVPRPTWLGRSVTSQD